MAQTALVSSAFALAAAGFLAGCGGATASDLFGTPPSVTDASVDAIPTDAGNDARDATPDTGKPPSPIVACGPPLEKPQSKCDATKKEYCCRRGDTDPYDYACETDPTACSDPGDVTIQCSSTQNCAAIGLIGSVCCGTLVGTGGGGSVIVSTQCTSTSNCTSGGSVGKAILCDPGAPNNCPNGGTCKLSQQTMPGYYLCI
jgi:hypothetical protein